LLSRLRRIDYTDFGQSKQSVFFERPNPNPKTIPTMSRSDSASLATEYVLTVGIDWADQHHELCQRCCATGAKERQQISADPASLKRWLANLKAQAGAGRVAVAFEQNRSALFELLAQQSDWLDLFPLNPLTVKRYREAFFPSGPKDDPLDGELIEELVASHRGRLRPYRAPSPAERQLQLLTRERRRAVDAGVALENELRATLKIYYPLVLELHDDLGSSVNLHFLARWPTLRALRKARCQTLSSFYYQHHSRSQQLIAERLEKIAQAQLVLEDQALEQVYALTVQRLVNQLLQLSASIRVFEKRIAELYKAHPDHALFASLPGAGPTLGPRLLCALGSDRSAFALASELQKRTGTAPVLDCSGQRCVVRRRRARPKFDYQSFEEFAACSIAFSTWAKRYYQTQRAKGKTHRCAIRALAFKWQRVIFRIWQDRIPYEENRYLQVLENRHSPLATFA
jgi:transposase